LPDLPPHYWLVPRNYYVPFAEEMCRLSGLLADATSRRWLAGVLRMRLTDDYAALPEARTEDQYHPVDLPRWPEPLRFVDCGAFTGDTLAALESAGYRLDAVAAFEPDLANFNALAQVAGRWQSASLFPCGVAERNCRVGFAAGHGGASHLDDASTERVVCVALDEALQGFRPNLIKMDVEGAEPLALRGAAQTIARDRPALAISVYHHPEHLWSIAFQIDAWRLGYRFYLRGHAQSSFDLVLYALPPDG
jgi:FkbM family methyltransferase